MVNRTVVFPEGIADHFAEHSRRVESLLRSVREQLPVNETRKTLEAVLEYALVQLTDIQGAWEAPYLGVLAGATLNLLELNMLTHYLSLDHLNAKRMMMSALIEELGIFRALADLKEVGEDEAVIAEGIAEQEKLIQERTARHNIAYEEIPSFTELAQAARCVDQYRALSFLCGKFTHPSALALFRSPKDDTLDRVVGEILTQATYYVHELTAKIGDLTGIILPPANMNTEDGEETVN